MTLASIPSPSISTFEIGPLTIHLYALCILAGIIAAVAITTARWKRVGGDFDQIEEGRKQELGALSEQLRGLGEQQATWSTAWPTSCTRTSARSLRWTNRR